VFPESPVIDGSLDDDAWQSAAWTEDFGSIVGPTGPQPWYRTQAKLLHDEKALYIAAVLEDKQVFAHQTLHDRCSIQHMLCHSAESSSLPRLERHVPFALQASSLKSIFCL
jgi:hypothetical protein